MQGPATPLGQPRMTPDDALRAAVEKGPAGYVAATITLPTQQAPAWRVVLTGDGVNATVNVDDATGAVRLPPAPAQPSSGDLIARWMRWLHVGTNTGLVWQAVIFVGGLLPALFAVTGIMMWLRRRKTEQAMAARRARNQARGALPQPNAGAGAE
ncbi:PepSY domain-containing protein [Oleomonas cavernae]|uniref:PepSY domain-containing protein n=2 Tax=Oleomonas cavernae TaxID=2320859 RepID=A0A418VU28_9PROT|nr:PepSY domain-containing protein [Oleomonas cavernae]